MHIKKYKNGTHRHCSPKQTLENVSPFLKKMGITRVANLTGLDNTGIPVIGVFRPNAKSLATSQGKGHSLDAAKVSGIMESIECYHAENIDLDVVLDNQKNLDSIINYDLLPRSCEKEFDETSIIPWVKGKNIKDEQHVWLPYELAHTNFTVPYPENHGYFMADSNGLASGNTTIEAINHGLYEVIERDCLVLWELTPQIKHDEKRIDLNSIKDEFLNSILRKLEKNDIHIGIWDITSDIKIPTFICKIVSGQNRGIRPAYGSGTHLNKNIALSRAITEAVQSRVTFIAGARDDQYHDVYKNEISEDVYRLWLDEIQKVNTSALKSFESIPLIDFETLEEDQNYTLQNLSEVGIHNACYVDLTKPEFNIPVVKIIIPGTEGIDYSGKRLLGQRGLKFYNKYGVGACEVK